MRALILAAVLALSACTDATLAKLGALGNSGTVECFSGGKPIYSGESTGKIHNGDQSDGYYFNEKVSRQLVEVSGDCIVRYGS